MLKVYRYLTLLPIFLGLLIGCADSGGGSSDIAQSPRPVAQPDVAILDVAMSCGFNSKSTFNAAFKKLFGVTPSEYRRGEVRRLNSIGDDRVARKNSTGSISSKELSVNYCTESIYCRQPLFSC